MSEWSEEIRTALADTFGFRVAPTDPLLADLERYRIEASLERADLFRWFVALKKKKQELHYPIQSAGAVRDWARTDLATSTLPRKPMERERTSGPATREYSVEEEITKLQELLEVLPDHSQASEFRQRVQYLQTMQQRPYAAGAGWR